MLAFGPDGRLFVGLGDGGGANDQFGQGQDPGTLLGTLVRLDVDVAETPGIPEDNPFTAGGGDPAVWAYGLRNPWRFSFDDGFLYIGDVGQNEWEEIDVVPADAAGLNFGWPITEGTHCFRPSTECERAGLTAPVTEYSHSRGCSVTGGVVYRGSAVPGLVGHYLYGDFCGGWVRSFRFDDGVAVPGIEWGGRIFGLTSFGTDAAGEVYALPNTGSIWRVVPG
jgi:glucose/arabinose dehydrogenase